VRNWEPSPILNPATAFHRQGAKLVSWDQRFYDPISLPGRKPLVTLRDAAQFILKLPKAERELSHWQTAVACLMQIGDHGGDTMFAHIAMMQALHRRELNAPPAPRRKRPKVYKVVR
jgi:hypothetical protein